MRIDKRVSRDEGTGDLAINRGVTMPGREGACPTCGRMFDCCCEVEELVAGPLDRIKEMMGIEEVGGTPLTWQALRTLQEEVRR